MMMARESTPDRPQLDAAAVDALTSALLRYLADGDDGAPLQAALRQVALQAREKRMHAEQLLMELKDVWYELPPIKKTPEGPDQTRMLQRVVTLCIREYYSL